MAFYRWIGTGDGNFADAANWFDASTGTDSTTVPGPGDIATFYGAGAIDGTGTVGILNFARPNGQGYSLNGTFTATKVLDRGTLTLGQGSTLNAHVVDVGSAAATGFLDISNAHLNGLANGLDLNVSNGTAVVEASGSSPAGTLSLGNGTVQIGVGGAGPASLYLGGLLTGGRNSSILVGNASSYGTLNLYSPSATIATTGSLVLGAGGGGFASLMDGGTIVVGHGSGAALILGMDETTPAFGYLQGVNAHIVVHGQAVVGDTGEGTLALTTSFLSTAGLAVGSSSGNGEFSQGAVILQGSRWIDAGSVLVGSAGVGTLTLEASGETIGSAVIQGDLSLGTAGRGEVLLNGSALQVEGQTTIGGASEEAGSGVDQVIVQGGGHWNSAGETITVASSPGAPSATNSLSVTGTGSTLSAGMLSIGPGAQASASDAAIVRLGTSTTNAGLLVDGTLSVASGARVTVEGTGTIAGGGEFGAPAQLTLDGGSATFTASTGPALILTPGGAASLSGSNSTLTAIGGIFVAEGTITTQGGTINATAIGNSNAVSLTNGGSISLDGGALNTHGLLLLGDGGGLLANAASITSTITGVGSSVAVSIGATDPAGVFTVDTNWVIGGSVDVGSIGTGSLLTDGGQTSISHVLAVGAAGSSGAVSAHEADTIVAGGTLTAGQTGIAAADIIVTGSLSSLSAGSLIVAPGAAESPLTIDGAYASFSGNALLEGTLTLSDGGTLKVGTLTGQGGTVLGQPETSATNVLLAATIATQGTVTLSGALVATVGSITGNGQLAFGTSASEPSETLTLTGQTAASATIAFIGAGTLATPSIADLASTIGGWQSGDAIDFAGTTIASLGFANGTLSLFGASQNLLGTETFASTSSNPITSNNFTLAADNHGGTFLVWH